MSKPFPSTAVGTKELAVRLVQHLKASLRDTHSRDEWTSRNFDALRSFDSGGYELRHLPDHGSYRKGAFLWDYVGYQENSGILIAAESEFDRSKNKLGEDFDKLLYVRAPIKVFLCWLDKDRGDFEGLRNELTEWIRTCSCYFPGEIFILYCRTWAGPDGNDDRVYWIQIEGEPCYRDSGTRKFELIPANLV